MKKLITAGALIAISIAIFPSYAIAAEAPLSLATASTYGLLAQTAITNAAASTVNGTAGGDVGVSGGTAPSGPLTFSGSLVLGGTSTAAMTSASNALAVVRSGTVTGVELGGGRTITPGAYTDTALQINGNLILDGQGNSSAVFIFRSDSTLITGTSSTVTLTGGAQACNVFWQIGSSATLGASSTISGHVIALASISTGLGSTVTGQLIATTGAITLGGTTITNTGCVTPAPTPAPTSAPVVVAVPAPPVIVETGTVRVIKFVDNGHLGKALASDFMIHVTQFGVEMLGSPNIGLSSPGRLYVLPVGSYFLFEDETPGYWGVWDGDITRGGRVDITKGSNLVVTRTNFDAYVGPVTVPVPTPTPTVTPTVTPTPTPEPTTEAGGVLPNTSTPYGNQALYGLGLVMVGLVGFATRKILVK